MRDGRPYGDSMNVMSFSAQVELNRIDSSITFRYGEFEGFQIQDEGANPYPSTLEPVN